MATSTTSDLSALRRACGPVISWYERFLSERRLDLHELDEALGALQRLPPMGGRVGRAVATIASGGAGASIEEVLGAFEVLRGATGLRAQLALPAGPGASPTVERKTGAVSQLPLPGLERG